MEMSSLKIIAGIAITENTYFSKEERSDILTFIKEDANEHELMSLILDAKVPTIMNESINKVIEARFNSLKVDNWILEIIDIMTEGEFLKEDGILDPTAVANAKDAAGNLRNTAGHLSRGVQRGVTRAAKAVTGGINRRAWALGTAGSMIGLWAGFRAVRAMTDSKKRRCGVLSIGKGRQVCFIKIEIEGLNKQLASLHQIKNQCQQQTDADMCIDKIMPKIEQIESSIAKAHTQLASLATKGANMQKTPGTMINPNAMRVV